MEIKQIITATVAVILICLVAIPIIEDSSQQVRSYDNNSTQRFLVSDKNATVDLKPNEDGIYTVNGLVIPQTYMNIFVTTDDMVCYYGNSTITAQNIKILCTDGLYDAHHLYISDGVWSAYSSTNELVVSKPVVGSIYCLSESGTYGYFNPSSSNPLYINDDSNLMAISYSLSVTSGGETVSLQLYCRGTYDDLKVAGCYNVTAKSAIDPSLVTLSPIVSDMQDNGSIEISNATVTATLNLDGKTYTGSKNMVLYAPIEYIKISENDSVIITILNLIPVMLVVALVLGIGYSIARRD